MSEREPTVAVSEILKGFHGTDDLKRLLWSELNFNRENVPLSRSNWPESAAQWLVEDPVVFASAGINDDFRVIYSRLDNENLLLTAQRQIITRLLREHPYAMFVFSNKNQDKWHFVNVRYDEGDKTRKLFRRITVGPTERIRTASERIAFLDVASIGGDGALPSPLELQRAHDKAFDVEAVTKKFFTDYKLVFARLEDNLMNQVNDRTWAHDYALQLLNRLMFLCFVQRKGWLGSDVEFLRLFWNSYKNSGQPADSFFRDWLEILFFEAFNKRFVNRYDYFPEDIVEILMMAPYLNGGLFAKNRLDEKPGFTIADDCIDEIFAFLESYNFTIAEDTPFDQEVAVDPEMIGKVYEGLVNLSEEIDERGEAGIFYTERTEIQIMCRLALVDYMANHLGSEYKDIIYEVIFAMEQEEKIEADRRLDNEALWPRFTKLLENVTVVDPACGSGAFLVGMLDILDDLTERADHRRGLTRSGFERKKRIIGQNLYGVDVMEWACHIAELRLWLSLIVDAEFTGKELHHRSDPLLPNFTFKIRCGDSLVQEVGGVNLSSVRGQTYIPPDIKQQIADLKDRKLRFYHGDPGLKRADSAELIEEQELELFRRILENRRRETKRSIESLRRRIESPMERQMRLDGTVESESRQLSLAIEKWQRELESLETELSRIDASLEALKTNKNVPFVWDVAFVEIFESEKNGFDIVIGNPPYVRHESIYDPRFPRDEVTGESNAKYKAMLARSVYQAFPNYFNYRLITDKARHPLGMRSDLYIYFYFKGLSLLNSKGSFCFVTSNSWLDVAYGARLQEFLIKHCHIKMVLDNAIKRSFSSADINTVIVLFSAPDESREWGLERIAKFVMFKVPFEQVLLSVPAIAFQDIEDARSTTMTPDYRISSPSQRELFREGCRNPESRQPAYTGGKWGGKFLRAPDIYWTIQQQGAGKLVKLGDLAEVRFGIKTGANDFFHVQVLDVHNGIAHIRSKDGTEHMIESNYVQEPVLTKTREIVRPRVTVDDLEYRLVVLDEEAANKPYAARYIRWGEAQGFHRRPTIKSRRPWWVIRVQDYAAIAFPMAHKRRPVLALLEDTSIHLDNRLYAIRPKRRDDALLLAASLSSTFSILSREICGRANFGQGMLDMKVYEAEGLEVLDPSLLSNDAKHALLTAYDSISRRKILMLYDGVRLPDRQALDDAFLLALGFSNPEERASLVLDLQGAACRMIWNRLAKSDKERESRMAYDYWKDSGQPFDSQAGEYDEE